MLLRWQEAGEKLACPIALREHFLEHDCPGIAGAGRAAQAGTPDAADGPIRSRKRGYILTRDQSDAGSVGMWGNTWARTAMGGGVVCELTV